MKNYFDSWGSEENPIRENDLENLFGRRFGCAKRFALARLYPRGKPSIGWRQAISETTRGYIRSSLKFGSFSFALNLKIVENAYSISWGDNRERTIEEYTKLSDDFLEEYSAALRPRILEAGQEFVLDVDGIWVAGEYDLVINGSGGKLPKIMLIKTGDLISQYEMDNGFRGRIHKLALLEGLTRIKAEDGHVVQDIRHEIEAEVWYINLVDMYLAQRSSKRKSRHRSTQPLADASGMVETRAGTKKGPVFYQAEVRPQKTRLGYSLRTAIAMSQSGLWPESFGIHCQTCGYADRCETLEPIKNEKQMVLDLMDQIGIEPE